MADQVRNDPADPDQADHADDQAEPFRVRRGEGKRCDHDAPAR